MNFGFTFVNRRAKSRQKSTRRDLSRISHEELERYVAACAAASLISPTPTLEVAS